MSSGVCKAGTGSTMSDSEESISSEAPDSQIDKHDLKGEDIFGKYDYSKTSSDTEMSEMETDYDDEDESQTFRRKKTKTSPWDKLVNNAFETLQEDFNETVEHTLAEHPDMDTEEAEERAYEELEPDYRSKVIARYQELIRLGTAMKKDPVHKKLMATAHRLRDEEDYDEEEAMKYAIKKRRYLLERKLDEYERPNYSPEEEETLNHLMPAVVSNKPSYMGAGMTNK